MGGAVSYEEVPLYRMGSTRVTSLKATGVFRGACHPGGNLEASQFPDRYSSQFKNNYFTEMCSGSEAGSYLRLIDLCITQL